MPGYVLSVGGRNARKPLASRGLKNGEGMGGESLESLASLDQILDQLPSTAAGNVRKLLVRKRGFEPRCSEERQPLKLVRLPVPPLPRRALLRCSSHVGTGRRTSLRGWRSS